MTPSQGDASCLSTLSLVQAHQQARFPHEPWSKVVQRDLAETAEIRLEIIDSLAEAQSLVAEHKRAAVVVFKPTFSLFVSRCSFLVDGINPFHRDGVYLDEPGKPSILGVEMLKDGKQPGEAAIIEQIAQVTMLRVVLPWMIGKAFEKLSEDKFIEMLGTKVNLPVPTPESELKAQTMIRWASNEDADDIVS